MKRHRLDLWIFYIVLTLMAFGIIMVYSSSAFYAEKFRQDHLFYLKKQLLWVFTGIIIMMTAYKFPYEKFQQKSWIFIVISFLLLVFLLITHRGRWIGAGFFHIQVADIARLSIILFFADSLSRKEQYLSSYTQGFIPHLFYVFLFAGLIVLQPDFSSAFMLSAIAIAMMFISPIPIKFFLSLSVLFIPLAVMIIKSSSYKLARITGFLNPESDVLGKGYQIIQSLISLGAGGITGRGFAQSNQKLFFLPEAHTDFIFSIIGEEWGFVGTSFVVLLFAILAYRGILIIKKVPDKYSKYLAFGLTANIIFYALINMMVAVHLAPPTGLPLPFISYGGSSLLTCCLSIGLLLNISAQGRSSVQVNSYHFAQRAMQNYNNRKLRYLK